MVTLTILCAMSLRHLFVVSFVFVASVASAQTVPITGRVAAPRARVGSGPVVTLNPSSAAARTTSSTADGTFSFAGVPAGLAVLQVESPGFERWIRNVAVSSATFSLDVTLQLGGLAETVAVEAPKLEEELPQEVERAGSRIQTITSEQIENGGYDDVGQALQSLVPGLFLAPKAGPLFYVAGSLQGEPAHQTLG